jgi:hypothetical protein
MSDAFTKPTGLFEIIRYEHAGVNIVYLRNTKTGELQALKVRPQPGNPYTARPLTRSETLVHVPGLPQHPTKWSDGETYKGEAHTCTFQPAPLIGLRTGGAAHATTATRAATAGGVPSSSSLSLPFIQRVADDLQSRRERVNSPERRPSTSSLPLPSSFGVLSPKFSSRSPNASRPVISPLPHQRHQSPSRSQRLGTSDGGSPLSAGSRRMGQRGGSAVSLLATSPPALSSPPSSPPFSPP